MTVELLHNSGLYQFCLNEIDPRQVLVRHNKLGARWWLLGEFEHREQAMAALLEARTADHEDMLRVTIEVIPFGIEKLAKTLHTVIISNDLTASDGSGKVGNYDVGLKTPGEPGVTVRVEGHRRADGTLWLAKNGLEAIALKKAGKL